MKVRIPLAIICLFSSAATAQQPPTFVRLEAGTCSKCTVSLELIATIGKATDKELIPGSGHIVSLADGSFVYATVPPGVPLLHYDKRGAYIGTLGRLGDGPGEYRWPQSVVRARGDSISIMGQRRITTISTVTGKGRSEPMPPKLDGIYHTVLRDGSVVFGIDAQYQLAFGLLTPQAVLKKQFGPKQPPLVLVEQGGRTIGDFYANMSAMAPSPSSGLWTASIWYAHHIVHYTADGAIISDIRRNPSWFKPYAYVDVNEKLYRLGELRAPRPPVTSAIAVDSSGHVLVLSRVADANWKKDPKAPPPPPPGGEYPVVKLEPTGGIDRYIDTILEVYDDRSAAFLGSWRSDAELSSMMPNGLVFTQSEDADGLITIKVYRVRVTS